jgi:hypothetical protein
MTKSKKTTAEAIHPGMKALREILRGMRLHDQGGYTDVGKDGKFAGHAGFISSGIGQATPEQLDALFDLAGIVPDAIEPLGSCRECVWGDARGGDLGWGAPCAGCCRPKMTNFVALSSFEESALKLTEIEAAMLENYKVSGRWWAKGIVISEQGSTARQEEIASCNEAREHLMTRGMLGKSLGNERITNKGARALALHKKKGKAA